MKESIIGAVVVAIIIIVICLIISLPIMWIWNGVMPVVCGFQKINFEQALCIAILGRLISGATIHRKEDK